MYHRRHISITAILVLLSLVGYTISPLYASFSNALSDSTERSDRMADKKVTYGILWVSVVLDEVFNDQDQPVRDQAAQIDAQESDDDLVLVKRKRALLRERLSVRPYLQCIVLSIDRPVHEVVPHIAYEIPRDLIHLHSDGYHSISTGLSPPQHLS